MIFISFPFASSTRHPSSSVTSFYYYYRVFPLPYSLTGNIHIPMMNGSVPSENGGEGSALIFLGTGCSSAVPNAMCLIQKSDPPCYVCSQSLSIPPEKNPNYRYIVHTFECGVAILVFFLFLLLACR